MFQRRVCGGSTAMKEVFAEAGQHEDIHYLPVDIISASSMSKDEFAERYVGPSIPCIIEDLVNDWPAYTKWTKSYFTGELGQTPMHYHDIPDASYKSDWEEGIPKTTLGDFIDRIDRGEQIKHFAIAHPYYDFVTTHPTLMSDVCLESFKALLPVSRFYGLDRLDSRFWPWVPPYPPEMFIAGPGSLSPGHYDPDHSHTFHWCVWGHKSVKMFPYVPETSKQLWAVSHLDFSKPFDAGQLEEFPALKGLKGWSVSLMPGQILFLPSRTWHFFKYEETSMSFVARYRSFDSLSLYCDFAEDVQSPVNTIPFYAGLWRKIDHRERTFLGNLLARHERFARRCTQLVLKLLWWFTLGRRCMSPNTTTRPRVNNK